MLPILTAYVIDIFHLAGSTSVPGYTTTGTEFVYGCYGLYRGWRFTGTLNVLSNLFPVIYRVWEPKEYNSGNYTPMNTYTRRMGPWTYNQHKLNDICKVISPGIYQSYRMATSVPVAVIYQIEFLTPDTFRETFKLVPLQSCFKMYHITTNKGYPFMSVHAFSYTNLTVHLAAKSIYDIPCWKNSNQTCSPGTVVTVSLEPHQFWYFLLDDSDADLQGTTLQCDNPVFVVAGNLYAHEAVIGKDLMASPMKPTVAWGKMYVIPHFFVAESLEMKVVFRIVAENFPFQLSLIQGFTKRDIKKIISFDGEFIMKKTKRPFAAISKTPFGLHAMMPATRHPNQEVGHVSLVNIIPVEQWMNGFFRIVDGLEVAWRQRFTFFALSTTHPKNVFFTRYHTKPAWEKLWTINAMTFYLTKLTSTGGSWDIYVKNTSLAKVMLYIKYEQNASSSTVYPYDFYQGAIFQPNCTTVVPVVSDGVDNDCDGFIDEEISNDKDDDGDDEVDEDLVEAYRSGEWSAWIPTCNITCQEQEITRYGRECLHPSRFGTYCAGEVEMCDNHESCPKSCSGGDLQQVCWCTSTCSECTPDGYACKRCNSSYRNTTHCLDKCPFGWTGWNCTHGPRTLADFLALEQQAGEHGRNQSTSPKPTTVWPQSTTRPEQRRHGFPLWTVVTTSGLFGVAFLCLLIITVRRCHSPKREVHFPDRVQNPDIGAPEADSIQEMQNEYEKQIVEVTGPEGTLSKETSVDRENEESTEGRSTKESSVDEERRYGREFRGQVNQRE